MADALRLWRGSVAWADLSPTRGRERAGRRPVLVVASQGYLDAVTSLVVVLPVTTVDRGRPNHVPVRGAHGLARPSRAMTEQVRTVARDRLVGVAGLVDDATLGDVHVYLRDFLGVWADGRTAGAAPGRSCHSVPDVRGACDARGGVPGP